MTEKQIAELPRTELEENLSFVGLLLFQNEMKLESPQAIQRLKLACSWVQLNGPCLKDIGPINDVVVQHTGLTFRSRYCTSSKFAHVHL